MDKQIDDFTNNLNKRIKSEMKCFFNENTPDTLEETLWQLRTEIEYYYNLFKKDSENKKETYIIAEIQDESKIEAIKYIDNVLGNYLKEYKPIFKQNEN